VPVRARTGDYINTAFAPDRAMRDMSLRAYLDLVDGGDYVLPPYVGNLELRELNGCATGRPGSTRWGRRASGSARPAPSRRCIATTTTISSPRPGAASASSLAPPHHDEFLYVREANAVLFGSPVDPEAPDFERYPLARQANMIECVVKPGEMLYVPAGWFHQVRALAFSLSVNRWARALPLALKGDTALLRPAA
jgi:hypothetical protein